jgi:ferredoxin-NADP reductase
LDLKLELLEKFNETEDVVSFIFKPLEGLKWKAGQFVYYKIPHENPDNRGIIRHFTIASAPHEKHIRLTTRFFAEGGSSFKKALNNLEIGSQVDTFEIEGSFTLEDYKTKYVFIAGGIGITPFRSILLDLSNRGEIKDIILFYGSRDENIVFDDDFNGIALKNPAFKIHNVISPDRIDIDILRGKVPDIFKRKCYISGPMVMIKSVEECLIELGISSDMIKTDYFSGY